MLIASAGTMGPRKIFKAVVDFLFCHATIDPGHRNDINISLFANSNSFLSHDLNNLKSTSSDKIPSHILELQVLASNENMYL